MHYIRRVRVCVCVCEFILAKTVGKTGETHGKCVSTRGTCSAFLNSIPNECKMLTHTTVLCVSFSLRRRHITFLHRRMFISFIFAMLNVRSMQMRLNFATEYVKKLPHLNQRLTHTRAWQIFFTLSAEAAAVVATTITVAIRWRHPICFNTQTNIYHT